MVHFTLKPWGRLRILPSVTEGCETHYLQIKPNQQCSVHRHRDKRNLFFVITGQLVITQWLNDKEEVSLLKIGEDLIVEAGILHQFKSLDDPVQCLEQYWVTDIQREKVF